MHDDILCLHDGVLCMDDGMLCMHVSMVCPMNAIDMLEILSTLNLTPHSLYSKKALITSSRG